MIAIIGTSDQPCWLAEACKIRLLLLVYISLQKLKVFSSFCAATDTMMSIFAQA